MVKYEISGVDQQVDQLGRYWLWHNTKQLRRKVITWLFLTVESLLEAEFMAFFALKLPSILSCSKISWICFFEKLPASSQDRNLQN